MRTFALFMSLLVSAFFMSSCNFGSSDPKDPIDPNAADTTVVKPEPSGMNCNQEFNDFVAKEFNTTEEARKTISEYLSAFINETQCFECCEMMRQIEAEFVEMDNLFSIVDGNTDKNRYCAFAQMMKSDGDRFSNSRFETVRKTWKKVTDEKNDIYAKERLDLINEDDFRNEMLKFAEDLATEWYGKGGKKTGWHVCGSSINGKMEIVSVEGKPAKRCTCEVKVDMKGNLIQKEGTLRNAIQRKGSTVIRVEGTIEIDSSDCSLFFEEGDYDQISVRDGLERVERRKERQANRRKLENEKQCKNSRIREGGNLHY